MTLEQIIETTMTKPTPIVSIAPAALDLNQAAAYVALSVSTLEKLVREGRFPKPRQLSDRRVAWIVAELNEWVHMRPVSELPPPPNTGALKPRQARPLHTPADARQAA